VSFKIYFLEASERPVELFHLLNLYPLDGSPLVKKRLVVFEQYDEIVFHEPTESLYAKLKQYELASGVNVKIDPHPLASFTNISLDENGEAKRIRDAKKKIKAEYERLHRRYEDADDEVESIKRQLASHGSLIELGH
jgi:hypothetical protein